ncbi:class I SAM-dependent methyltransferase [Sphingobium sp. YR768]|uniref:class I SAM-dependent methyltransferase n=1 Tax=Sphingobium sp. YR768 TaxID=1884365 RepID=UPI000B8697EE|nr:class I SAM-dependent methyltransferase [Sphingobium sp. YR768]
MRLKKILKRLQPNWARKQPPVPVVEPKPTAAGGSFLPDMDKWVHLHYVDSIDQVVTEIGDPTGKIIMDLGCGEMLMTYGLAARGAAQVVGLDVSALNPEAAATRLIEAGFPEAETLKDRVTACVYDGRTMPFSDDHFDVVFSWGVMEHVADVPAVLAEIKRVLKPGGVAFIKVFPWFHSYYGSHLSDFIPTPFAHLTFDSAAMRAVIEKTAHEQTAVHPNLILGHMWDEYLTLNRYSANMFYRDVKAAGFTRDVWKLISHQHDLSHAPAGYDLSDLMVSGSDTLLYK